MKWHELYPLSRWSGRSRTFKQKARTHWGRGQVNDVDLSWWRLSFLLPQCVSLRAGLKMRSAWRLESRSGFSAALVLDANSGRVVSTHSAPCQPRRAALDRASRDWSSSPTSKCGRQPTQRCPNTRTVFFDARSSTTFTSRPLAKRRASGASAKSPP